MSLVICALNITKQNGFKKNSSSGVRTLTDDVTGAHSNRCTNYFYLSLCMSITFYEIKSNTRLSIKSPQTPELAYDCFRTVISATSNLNDNIQLQLFTRSKFIYQWRFQNLTLEGEGRGLYQRGRGEKIIESVDS